MKRPLIFAADIVNAAHENSPIKKYAKKDTKHIHETETQEEPKELKEGEDEDATTDETKTLSFKEQVMKLDDKKKRAFMHYNRWRNSLFNEKNIDFIDQHQLLIENNLNYEMYCTKQGHLMQNN